MQISQQDTYRHKGLRKQLVRTLIGKGITNQRVLMAIEAIPRHFFLDPAFDNHAYQDKAFGIDAGQTISQPYTVARQTELLELAPGQKVLEIGTGSGYQCAVLCALGIEVYSIEYIPLLHTKAANLLQFMGYTPHLFCGDGSGGLPAYAPYDGIIVTAGAPALPDTLIRQLKHGGKLVIPIGDAQTQRMMRYHKLPNGDIVAEDHGQFAFVPLVGNKGWR